MSGLAHMFLDRGIAVSGSDRADSPGLRRLEAAGARVVVGHAAENVPDEADTVVHTGAIWPDNPELLVGRQRGLSVIHRSQALHWLVGDRRLISVAGAHGKTTSTGMITVGLHELGHNPAFVNGGVIEQLGRSSGSGDGTLFVIEADESDGTFELYNTAVALITNVDPDHLDHWGTERAVDEAFVRFANAATEAVVLSADDPGARRIEAAITHPRVLTFGLSPHADVSAEQVDTAAAVSFTLVHGTERARVNLAVPGAHNVLNATGAAAVLLALGHDLVDIAAALSAFAGTQRRFELHGVERGVAVYDDYAHHPAEVDAALRTARDVAGDHRVIAVHQPHTYSRTRDMFRDFARVLETLADHSIVLDVYGAREDPIPGVTGELVSAAFDDPSHVSYVPDWGQAAKRSAQVADEGDVMVTLGCGNVNLIVPQLLAALAEGDTPESGE